MRKVFRNLLWDTGIIDTGAKNVNCCLLRSKGLASVLSTVREIIYVCTGIYIR